MHKLIDAVGNQLGFVLGFVIERGKLLLSSSSLEFPVVSELSETIIERRLRDLSGRFLLLVLTDEPGVAMA